MTLQKGKKKTSNWLCWSEGESYQICGHSISHFLSFNPKKIRHKAWCFQNVKTHTHTLQMLGTGNALSLLKESIVNVTCSATRLATNYRNTTGHYRNIQHWGDDSGLWNLRNERNIDNNIGNYYRTSPSVKVKACGFNHTTLQCHMKENKLPQKY